MSDEANVRILTLLSSLDRIHKCATRRWREGPVDQASLQRDLDDIVTVASAALGNEAQYTLDDIRRAELRGMTP
jgi:hypothetical protein